ncbi:MAG: hypothetical protein PHH60_04860 [Candidatus Margulisbacteria bacterium]|nr:hypothetical protein [Candidatus Margulisiibacteriota bacterium]
MTKHAPTALLFLLIGINLAFAQEIPVNVKAEKLKFIEGTGLVEATGSVEVRFKNVVINSDYLWMDSNTNIATAEGHVKISTADYLAFSDCVIYDATSEVSNFSNFESKFSPEKINGNIYITAQELNDLGTKMLGKQGTVTTCDDEVPHYFTVADRVEYYPEDKIVGYNVTVYVGEMPVLWTPYMIYNLNDDWQRNWVFGHNEVEGDYLKSTWGYPLGLLYLDLMEKKGFGKGTQVGYNLMGLGLGTLFLYQLDEKDTGITDWVTRINHTKQINQWTTFKLDHNYTATYLIPSGRKDQTGLGLSLGYKNQARWDMGLNTFDDRIAKLQNNSFSFSQAYNNISSTYNLTYNLSKQDPKTIQAAQRFTHQRPLWSDNVMFSTRAEYYNNVTSEGAPGDERLVPVVDITGRETGYSWRVSEDWYLDLDKDTYKGDENYQFLERQPEVAVTPDPLDLRFFNLRPSIGYGHYREVRYVTELGRNRDFSAERYSTTLNLDKSVPLALGTVMVLGVGLDQYLYSPGDAFYIYRESGGLRTDLGGFFRNDVNFAKSSSDGNSPFLFDKQGASSHYATEQMTFYYLNKVNWTINGGHNWQIHKWNDVTTNLTVRPDNRLTWSVATGWEIENRRYKDLVNSLNLSPYSYLTVNLATQSDINNGDLKEGSVLYDILFLEKEPNQWHVKFNQVYDPLSDQFKVRDIMVQKDLHCWDLVYTYSDYRKEFSVTFKLKALPDEPVGMSTGRGFYIESFDKQLKDFKPEGAVQRY